MEPMQPDVRAALPDVRSDVAVAGLDGEVTILRDGYGIPHVRATSLHDAFLGQGFAAAQDRLWQMELDRRKAAGRWAEVVGARAVEGDAFSRRAGFAEAARADLAALGDEARGALDAYAAGVNAFLRTTSALPVEYAVTGIAPEPWEPWQSCAVWKVRHLGMGPFHRKLARAALVRRAGPEVVARMVTEAAGEVLVVPPGAGHEAVVAADELQAGSDALAAIPDGEDGSNNWALHGSRTASGLPLVAGDSHRAFDLPNVYWQNHLTCPEIDAVGASFPGVPGFPHFGHNGRVAWCITNAAADNQDVFVERLDPAGAGARVETRGGWRDAPVRTERVEVRDGEPVDVTVVTTDHGPVVAGGPDAGVGLALRWTSLVEPETTFDALVPMLRAGTTAELEATMRPWVSPVNNLVSADVAGSISHLVRGRVAERPALNGWLPVPGWTGRHEWRGWVPFERMPGVRDPETGWLATANNRIIDEDWLGHDFDGPSRVARLGELLGGCSGATVADMARVHGDEVSLLARRLVPRFLAWLGDPGQLGEAERAAADRLRGWDATMAARSVAPTVYTVWRDRLTALVMAALGATSGRLGVLGDLAPPVDRARTAWRGVPQLVIDGRDDVVAELGGWAGAVRRALEEAVAWCEEHLGPDQDTWLWARVHTILTYHQLAVDFPPARPVLPTPTVAVGGDAETVRAGSPFPGYGYRAVAGSVVRYVFDVADWDASGWSVPLGVSGHPASPHAADQLEVWARCDLVPMPYTAAAVDAAAVTRQALRPA